MYYAPAFAIWEERKMCVVVQRHLAKGARCAPLLDTPGHWRGSGIEPSRTSETCSRFITDQGNWPPTPAIQESLQALPKPSWQTPVRLIDNRGSVPAAPDTPMTISWRPRETSLSLWTPIDQPSAVWIPSGASRAPEPTQGHIPAFRADAVNTSLNHRTICGE